MHELYIFFMGVMTSRELMAKTVIVTGVCDESKISDGLVW